MVINSNEFKYIIDLMVKLNNNEEFTRSFYKTEYHEGCIVPADFTESHSGFDGTYTPLDLWSAQNGRIAK